MAATTTGPPLRFGALSCFSNRPHKGDMSTVFFLFPIASAGTRTWMPYSLVTTLENSPRDGGDMVETVQAMGDRVGHDHT